jgi:hypothetical protein
LNEKGESEKWKRVRVKSGGVKSVRVVEGWSDKVLEWWSGVVKSVSVVEWWSEKC